MKHTKPEALEATPPPAPPLPAARLTAAEIRSQVNLLQEVMRAVMQEGTHFGVIPGTRKPTLYKAGSETLLATFRLGITPIVTDLSTDDEIRYRVEAEVFHHPTGVVLGRGIGEASTNEERYRWRAAVCPQEWDETPLDRRRTKYARGKQGMYTVAQVRTVPADLANTVLKMAKKRAQIDATLTVTAASDLFTQDIEDLPDDLRPLAEDGDAAPAPIAPPRAKEAPAPTHGADAGSAVVAIKDLSARTGAKPDGTEWTRYLMTADSGDRYATFNEDHALILRDARDAKERVRVTYTVDKFGKTITDVAIVTDDRT